MNIMAMNLQGYKQRYYEIDIVKWINKFKWYVDEGFN